MAAAAAGIAVCCSSCTGKPSSVHQVSPSSASLLVVISTAHELQTSTLIQRQQASIDPKPQHYHSLLCPMARLQLSQGHLLPLGMPGWNFCRTTARAAGGQPSCGHAATVISKHAGSCLASSGSSRGDGGLSSVLSTSVGQSDPSRIWQMDISKRHCRLLLLQL